MPTPHVSLREVKREERDVLANLLELYCHDLSPYFPVTLGPDGRFGYAYLPRYWKEPGVRFPLFIEADGALAGFALAMRGSPATNDASHLDVAEFFVLRALRKRGIGERAAALLWDALPGHWTVRVARANEGAVRFWERAITRYTGSAPHGRGLAQGGIDRVLFELDAPPPR